MSNVISAEITNNENTYVMSVFDRTLTVTNDTTTGNTITEDVVSLVLKFVQKTFALSFSPVEKSEILPLTIKFSKYLNFLPSTQLLLILFKL